MYLVQHKTKFGRIVEEHESSLTWVNRIVAAVMKNGGTVVLIKKY